MMCRELVILNLDHGTGDITEISSYSLMIEVFEKARDELMGIEERTGLEDDKLTMLHLMIEDAIAQRDNK